MGKVENYVSSIIFSVVGAYAFGSGSYQLSEVFDKRNIYVQESLRNSAEVSDSENLAKRINLAFEAASNEFPTNKGLALVVLSTVFTGLAIDRAVSAYRKKE